MSRSADGLAPLDDSPLVDSAHLIHCDGIGQTPSNQIDSVLVTRVSFADDLVEGGSHGDEGLAAPKSQVTLLSLSGGHCCRVNSALHLA